MVGWPPFLVEGGGILRVLYVSKTFKSVKKTRNTGTMRGMVYYSSEVNRVRVLDERRYPGVELRQSSCREAP